LFIDAKKICLFSKTKSLKSLSFVHQIFITFFLLSPTVKKMSTSSVRFRNQGFYTYLRIKVSSYKVAWEVKLSRLLLQLTNWIEINENQGKTPE